MGDDGGGFRAALSLDGARADGALSVADGGQHTMTLFLILVLLLLIGIGIFVRRAVFK